MLKMFLLFALVSALRADVIWSYTFTLPPVGSSLSGEFVIWNNGPITLINGNFVLPADQLHSCRAATSSQYCLFAGFGEGPDNSIVAVLSQQFFDTPTTDPDLPYAVFFPGVSLSVPGVFQADGATLNISDNPADLAPEPRPIVLAFVGLLAGCWLYRLKDFGN